MNGTSLKDVNARIVNRLLEHPDEWKQSSLENYHLLAATLYESDQGTLVIGQKNYNQPIVVIHANNKAIKLMISEQISDELPELFTIQDVERILNISGLAEKIIPKEGQNLCTNFGTKVINQKTISIVGSEKISSPDYLWIRMLYLSDITSWKKREETRDDFFSITSHELRTPLIAINGCAKLMIDFFNNQYPDNSLRDMLTEIYSTSDHLISMVNDFLNMSRLEQGRFSYKCTYFDPSQIIEEIIQELSPLAEERKLIIQFRQDFSGNIYADPSRLKQIIINLVGNAIKFTKQGSVTIKVVRSNLGVTIEVIDTGDGIAEEKQGALFQKFSQVASGVDVFTLDPNRSSGLGLYICKLMGEGMGCRVFLKSSIIGEGSTFAVEVPISPQ